MIKASATAAVPWGHICGYPIRSGGDLYGGAMYLQSSTAGNGSAATPQGRAVRNASRKFGDGETLPFAPCKRGYIPVVNGERMYGCHIHHDDRRKRVEKDGGTFRPGEKRLTNFWSDSGDAENVGNESVKGRKVGESNGKRAVKKVRTKDESSYANGVNGTVDTGPLEEKSSSAATRS